MILKKGDRGGAVKDLQKKLSKILNMSITIDGVFGRHTQHCTTKFQRLFGLEADGIAEPLTLIKLNEAYTALFKENSALFNIVDSQFVVFVDAGHGGVDDSGRYVTAGKRWNHKGEWLHERGWYYEGYENRIAAELFIRMAVENGINCVRTYHSYKDTELAERVDIMRSWLKRGYFGYCHSFHSNAVSSKLSDEDREKVQGYCIFTSTKNNFSDQIATVQWRNTKKLFEDWKIRKQDYKDKDVDHEADFYILREAEEILTKNKKFGIVLEEFGFHTSKKDAKFIIANRLKRAKAVLETAKWVKSMLIRNLINV